ncbi:YqcI/YcgG family protein [Pseudomonas monteilii]|uniref:YqcI/YcgG family protein n=1 Tax=Pseudomonas monteilii TaxID=76759 RepID=UPI001CBCEF09|nr:YqcI/YcgG family protein [Pseudomonas monteilii]MBZ3665443.1 YqcI/YcgG family protein [Pseudomonas monteilii]MBZ3670787.1 YqcI/YcgG family protein [Pseudomonas monteilii]
MFTGYGNCYRLDALELADEHVWNTQHWTYQTIEHFRSILANPDFPCLFGRKAVNGETCHILFAGAEQLADNIAQGLADYVRTVTPIKPKQRISSPLVVFLETAAGSTLAEQQALAWKVLRGVHARDPHPWPQGIPTDPDDTAWSFCYAGMPLFINMNFPGHQQMKSRNLGQHITFVINPRENFDEVANANTESGRKIRERIRERVHHYNDGVVPDTLGFFGDADNYEWKQYQLQEAGSLNPSRCPFHAHAAHPAATDILIEN